jgi:hypothetical protein
VVRDHKLRETAMTQQPQRPTEVLGALPHRRPNRRSAKRGASAPGYGEPAVDKPAESPSTDARSVRDKRPAASPPPGERPAARTAPDADPAPSLPRGREVVGTMVQAAAELAEIGLSASARAFREAVARLPRP